jgi:hypothetical protein
MPATAQGAIQWDRPTFTSACGTEGELRPSGNYGRNRRDSAVAARQAAADEVLTRSRFFPPGRLPSNAIAAHGIDRRALLLAMLPVSSHPGVIDRERTIKRD